MKRCIYVKPPKMYVEVEITKEDVIQWIESCENEKDLQAIKYKLYSVIHNLREYGVPYEPDYDDFRSRA